MTKEAPLLSPKPFSAFEPEEFKSFVESLYQAPPPKKEYSVTLNAKGNLVVRISRAPKYLTRDEVTLISKELGVTFQSLWMHLRGKKIEIR